VRRLLDRQLGDVDHGAAELAVELLRLLELVVDLGELGVLAVAARRAHRPHPGAADLDEPVRVDREADDPGLVDLEQLGRRRDPLNDRDVRSLVTQVAEVDRERRFRRARREPGVMVAAWPETRATASIGWPSRSQ